MTAITFWKLIKKMQKKEQRSYICLASQGWNAVSRSSEEIKDDILPASTKFQIGGHLEKDLKTIYLS